MQNIGMETKQKIEKNDEAPHLHGPEPHRLGHLGGIDSVYDRFCLFYWLVAPVVAIDKFLTSVVARIEPTVKGHWRGA
jgi:hypothetical protein